MRIGWEVPKQTKSFLANILGANSKENSRSRVKLECYKKFTFLSLAFSLITFSPLASCAGDHWFPRAQPLFPGVNEASVSASARAALSRAKADFSRARRGESPLYAHFTGTAPSSNSRVYEGDGYRITLVNKYMMVYSDIGADIVLDSSITGGQPLHYSEVDRVGG